MQRLRSQLLLTAEPATDVLAAVRRVTAVQAQLPSAARLAVRARTSGCTVADVDAAVADGRLVRTWMLRGTLHLVAAEDVRWLLGLLGPVFAVRGRRRREQLGLAEWTCERALPAIADVLRGSRALTRAELITELAGHGVAIDPGTQAPAHLVGYAALRGLICCGPDADTFVLLDEWVAPADQVPREEALGELAQRYLAGHVPAGPSDLQAWSGLSAADARHAFELASTGSRAVDSAAEKAAVPLPRLLGHFDPLLLGYHDRDAVLDPRYASRIQAGGGFIRPAVLVDGQVTGTWRLQRDGRLAVEQFAPLPRESRAALAAEAADIGRFLGRDVTLEIAPPPPGE